MARTIRLFADCSARSILFFILNGKLLLSFVVLNMEYEYDDDVKVTGVFKW